MDLNNQYSIRNAALEDIDFIIDTIIAAEKSSTGNLGLANYFEITEVELKGYLREMLDEEIDGCEFSVSSFVVAEDNGKLIGAVGGWVEGKNENDMSSAELKSNLLGYVLPKEVILNTQNKIEIVKDLQIDREYGAYQLEYSYVLPEYRGKHISQMLKQKHFDIAKVAGCKKVQTHVFASNKTNIRINGDLGFVVVSQNTSMHPQASNYYPDKTILLMERQINN